MKWSPASWTDCSSQSIHATASSMIGEPRADRWYPRPSNLSATFEAKRRQTGSCSEPRMLTQKRPADWIFGQLDEPRSGKNATSGGSRETDVNEPTAMPAGRWFGGDAVTTHTPVGYCAST